MLSISIRSYGTSDLEACRDLWRELTQRHRDIYGDQSIGGADPGAAFDAFLLRRPTRLWVAERDAEVVGLCGLVVSGEDTEVDPMVVRSGLRSQGIGGRLLGRAIEEARRLGVRFLSVRPVARNVEAISFYVDAGFRTLGYIDLFVELRAGTGREWKPGISIHGHEFKY